MILIHDYETIIFYTVTSLMILGILTLILTLIFSPYNNYQINVKNIIILPIIGDFNFLYY
jgi:hypothetical protein